MAENPVNPFEVWKMISRFHSSPLLATCRNAYEAVPNMSKEDQSSKSELKGNMKSYSAPITPKILLNPALVALLAFVTLNPGAFAGSKTWTGAINGNWSNPSNWNPSGPPQNGDELHFRGSDSNQSMNNDLSGLTIASLNFGDY